MKRLLCLVFIFFFSFFASFHSYPLYAQEAVIETDTPIGVDPVSTESAATSPGSINFELPYPGMLPDHPLYILKVMRDGVVKRLINEPIKRARFSLLVAEKRMYAGKLLIKKGKDKLALDTLIKSNNYLDDALKALEQVKRQSPKHMDIQPFLLEFRSAGLKHMEIMKESRPSVDRKFLPRYVQEEKRLEQYVKSADLLLRQK